MSATRSPAGRATLLTLVASAVLVAGCSGSSPRPTIDSAQVTATSGGAAGGTTTSAGPPAGPVPLADTPGAQVDAGDVATAVATAITSAGSATYTLASSGSSGQDASGLLNLVGSASSVSLVLTDGSDRLRVVSVPGALYADVGRVVDGKHWLKVTAGATDEASTAMAPLLTYMTNAADVSAQARSWAASNLFLVGPTRSIGGVRATEYNATIPEQAVLAALPAQFRTVMKATVTGDTDLRLWLDARRRPVRIVTTASYNNQRDTVTVDYHQWGSAGRVTTPPASDVIATPAG